MYVLTYVRRIYVRTYIQGYTHKYNRDTCIHRYMLRTTYHVCVYHRSIRKTIPTLFWCAEICPFLFPFYPFYLLPSFSFFFFLPFPLFLLFSPNFLRYHCLLPFQSSPPPTSSPTLRASFPSNDTSNDIKAFLENTSCGREFSRWYYRVISENRVNKEEKN